MEYITGESIAEQFNLWGVGTEFVDMQIAPQILTYNFNLKDIFQLQRIRKLLPMLRALTKSNFDLIDSETAHFALQTARKERGIINLTAFCKELEQAKPFTVALGIDKDGRKITQTLDELVHLLVAGTTGAGKSVALNDIILSLVCYNQPKDLHMVLIDPKGNELNAYNSISHLICPIITEVDTAKATLNNLIDEMERRYRELAKLGKEKNEGEFPKICVVIDELADLVLKDETIKIPLVKLLAKARACDIHFIICSQSPRAKWLDGLMLANLPSRIALTCASSRESVLILGRGGAEKLTFKGDAIIDTTNIKYTRIQIPYITHEQIAKAAQ